MAIRPEVQRAIGYIADDVVVELLRDHGKALTVPYRGELTLRLHQAIELFVQDEIEAIEREMPE